VNPSPLKRCLEYLSLNTNKGRSVSIGDVESSTMTSTVTVNRQGGYLGAIRGWAAADGALQQLQLVWALTDCPRGVKPTPAMPVVAPAPETPAAEAPIADAAAPAPGTEETVVFDGSGEVATNVEGAVAASPESGLLESAPVDEPAAAEFEQAVASDPAAEEPAAAAKPAAAAFEPITAVCAPKPDMCDVSAAAGANFCKASKPFESSKCVGGCCISSGRCKYGSCAANGLGKDAPLNCFKNNSLSGPLALLGTKCAHLACKLAVPGCKSAFMGGNCVGTVVAIGDVSKLHPQGAKYLGHPCVETTPTAGLVNVPKAIDFGLEVKDYVIAGWKICDCVDSEAPTPSVLKPSGSFKIPGLPHPKLPKFEMPKMPELPKFGLGGKNSSATVALSAGAGDSGDASLMAAGSKFGMMRDLIAGSMGGGPKGDPFADFLAEGAAGGADAGAAAGPESGLAAADPLAADPLTADPLAADPLAGDASSGLVDGQIVNESAPAPEGEPVVTETILPEAAEGDAFAAAATEEDHSNVASEFDSLAGL